VGRKEGFEVGLCTFIARQPGTDLIVQQFQVFFALLFLFVRLPRELSSP